MDNNQEMPLKHILKMLQEESFRSTYFGIPAVKCPLDFWVYREIIWEIKPDIIIEIGNYRGGSTLALAHILDNMGNGRVIGVDNIDGVEPQVKEHPRIHIITADACESFNEVKELIDEDDKVLIIEDSAHTFENTLNVLRTYSTLVTKGSYFIVEDSIINHGIDANEPMFRSGGPFKAIEVFIQENDAFMIDKTRERFRITWNPNGYLKRTRE